MIRLDILSDPICPWCYIGKHRLDRALEARPDHPFVIAWHPFQLNPDMPPGGMDRAKYMEAKFGGREGAVRAYAPILQAAEESGLDIAWERMDRVPNTLDAHRFVHWAGLEGRQTAAVSALFAAYFRDALDIGRKDVLLELAERIGLDVAMTERLLGSDADVDDIRERDAQARSMGVNGVPTFIVAGQQVVPGAQPTDLWLNVIDEVTGRIDTGDAMPDRPE